jgi:probable HAF family extracellular repeat protein
LRIVFLATAIWDSRAMPATITDLGTLGGGGGGVASSVTGINDSGEVAGSFLVGSVEHAFLYSDGVTIDIGALNTFVGSDGVSGALGLNNAGEVVGYLDGQTVSVQSPFLYANGVLTDIGNPPGQQIQPYPQGAAATAINSFGEIVGSTTDSMGSGAFIYSDGVLTDIGGLMPAASCAPFGCYFSGALGVNDSGIIVGETRYSLPSGVTASDGFVYADGEFTDLGYGEAVAINNAGQIAGYSTPPGTPPGIMDGGYIITDGVRTYLPLLPGSSGTTTNAINNLGQIVGESDSDTLSRTNTAFLYSNGVITDLNTLLPANSGWQLQDAVGINDSGQIVGYGTLNGQTRFFILDTAPVPEPGSLVLVCLGASGIILVRKSRVIFAR